MAARYKRAAACVSPTGRPSIKKYRLRGATSSVATTSGIKSCDSEPGEEPHPRVSSMCSAPRRSRRAAGCCAPSASCGRGSRSACRTSSKTFAGWRRSNVGGLTRSNWRADWLPLERQSIDRAEPVLYLHVLFGGGDKAHSLPVAAIEGETLSPLSQPSSKLLVIDTTLLLPLVEVGEHVRSIKGRLHFCPFRNKPCQTARYQRADDLHLAAKRAGRHAVIAQCATSPASAVATAS